MRLAGSTPTRFCGVRIVEEENNRLDFEVYNNDVVPGVEYRGGRSSCSAADTLGTLRKRNELFDKARQYPNWMRKLIREVIIAAPGIGLAQKFKWILQINRVHEVNKGPFVGNTTENADPYGQPLTYLAYANLPEK